MASKDDSLFTILLVGIAGYFLWRNLPQSAQNTAINEWDSATSNLTNAAMIATTGATRGERNNNPGNIKITNPPTGWQGLAPVQKDGTFVTFTSAPYGIRAIHKILLSYYSQGFDTVTGIISTWSATDQQAYIANVSKALGVGPLTLIDVTNPQTALSLVAAIIMQENGRNIYLTNGQLQQGMAMS